MAAKILSHQSAKSRSKPKVLLEAAHPQFNAADFERFEHLLNPIDEVAEIAEQLKDRVEAIHKGAPDEGQIGDADLYLANGLWHMAKFAQEMWLAFYWDLEARRRVDLEEKLDEVERLRSTTQKGDATKAKSGAR